MTSRLRLRVPESDAKPVPALDGKHVGNLRVKFSRLPTKRIDAIKCAMREMAVVDVIVTGVGHGWGYIAELEESYPEALSLRSPLEIVVRMETWTPES